jgi:dienelactone hydrolase
MGMLMALAGGVGALWWTLFALQPYDITPEQLSARYDHREVATPGPPLLQLGAGQPITVGDTQAYAYDLRFDGFDGVPAMGRIVYPADPTKPTPGGVQPRRPVVLALHGMGRTQWRWWQAAYKGRPTIESTHRVAEQALLAGHVVVALDARGHGDRKDPERPLNSREMLTNLELWGQREPYESLIVETVKDYRTLLDGLAQLPNLDDARVTAVGYSMGAQMALLLAGTDARVRAVAAMVPPGVDDKVAAVAPHNVAPRLGRTTVWLLTADDDEYASVDANGALFAALPGSGKRHLRFPGGHVLPVDYVAALQPWFASVGDWVAAGPTAGTE